MLACRLGRLFTRVANLADGMVGLSKALSVFCGSEVSFDGSFEFSIERLCKCGLAVWEHDWYAKFL